MKKSKLNLSKGLPNPTIFENPKEVSEKSKKWQKDDTENQKGAGMSRAAQKKRKREQKKRGDQQIRSTLSFQPTKKSKKDFESEESDEEDDESDSPSSHGSEEDDEDDEDDDQSNPILSRIYINDFDNLGIPSYFHPLVSEIASNSLQSILQLKDTVEATAQEKASLLLSALIHPCDRETFYKSSFSRNILIPSSTTSIPDLSKLFSKKSLKSLLAEHVLTQFEDVDIIDKGSIYEFAEVEPEGAESGQHFFKKFLNGKGIVFLKPQKYDDTIWNLFSSLEFEFNCRVDGCISLQPADHSFVNNCMNCDKFILQLEGSTSISLLERSASEIEDDEGNKDKQTSNERNKDKVSYQLKKAQVMYVPQGKQLEITVDDASHSLQLIICTNRRNKVADMLNFSIPVAIQNLSAQMNEFSQPLPADLKEFVGISASESDEDPRRIRFKLLLNSCFAKISEELQEMIDPAVDQITKNFIMERLPVPLTAQEEHLTAVGSPNAVIYPYTQLRLVRPGIAVAVVEDGKVVVYHCMDNARELFGNPLNPLEFELDDGPAIESLLKAYPEAVTVSDLEHPSEELDDKIGVAQALYKEGLLLISDAASRPPGGDDNEDDENDIF